MRPLVPQPKFNPPLLLKLVLIYGLIMFLLLLCLLVGAHVFDEFRWYLRDYQRGGMASVMESLRMDFWGFDSLFIEGIRQWPFLVSFLPFGIGGILGMVHYIIVRRRKTLAELIGQAETENS